MKQIYFLKLSTAIVALWTLFAVMVQAEFTPEVGRQYVLKNLTYNLYLDAPSDQQAVLAAKDESSLSQRFTIVLGPNQDKAPGTFHVQQVSSSNYLRKSGGNTAAQGYAYVTAMESKWPDNFAIGIEDSIAGGVSAGYKIHAKYAAGENFSGTVSIQANRYFCKNADNNNLRSIITGAGPDLWVIEAVSAIPALQTAYDEVNAFYATINPADVAAESAGNVPGKYSYASYTALASALAGAANILANPDTSAEGAIIAATLALTTTRSDFLASYYVQQNGLAVGDYLIRKAGTDVYWTNMKAVTETETPQFKALYDEGVVDEQIWTFTLDGGRYKIVNKHVDIYSGSNYNRYITENGTFPSLNKLNGYLQTWNTMNLYYNGTAYAVQRAGSSGSNYWRLDANDKITNQSNVLNAATDFIFELVDMPTALAQAVAAGQAKLDAATIGTSDGNYARSVYDAFAGALSTASALGDAATAQDLIDYKAAEALFVPTVATGLAQTSVEKVIVTAQPNAINVSVPEATAVSVYNATGQLIYRSTVSGETSIPVSAGIYLVKAENEVIKVIVKK
ncbi:T9SS type A sorting domain-containing protein [Viscerimonas tarda]